MRLCGILAAGTLVVASTLVGEALAWEPTLTSSGEAELIWWQEQVVMALYEACSDDVPTAACETSVWHGVMAWNAPDCSGLRLLSGGLSDESQAGYDKDNPTNNSNLIIFVESGWADLHPANQGSHNVALTTVTYNSKTGQIYDADIELNGDDWNFASLHQNNIPSPPPHYIQNIVTHEMGHVVGLADLYDPVDVSSTMYGTAAPGETGKMDLAVDDIDGLCTLYPDGPGSRGQALNDGSGVVGYGCGQTRTMSVHPAVFFLVTLAFFWRRRQGDREY